MENANRTIVITGASNGFGISAKPTTMVVVICPKLADEAQGKRPRRTVVGIASGVDEATFSPNPDRMHSSRNCISTV